MTTIQEIISALKTRKIHVFSQKIQLTKKIQFKNRKLRVDLTYDNLEISLCLYRNNENSPCVIAESLEEMLDEYLRLDGIPEEDILDELPYIKRLVEKLLKKELKFSEPHTYCFKSGKKWYIIDPGTSKVRLKKIKSFLKGKENSPYILNSHWHPDHWGNNGRITRKDSKVIYHQVMYEKFKYGVFKFLDDNSKFFFKYLDVGEYLRHNVKLPSRLYEFAEYMFEKFPVISRHIMTFFYIRIFGFPRLGSKYADPLEVSHKKEFTFGQVKFEGWKVSKDFFVLDAPAHTYDTLVFYFPGKKALYTGDIDVYLNPNNHVDVKPESVVRVIKKIIKLVKHEKIDLLLTSHDLQIVGSRNIVKYFSEKVKMLQDCYKIIKKMIECQDSWVFQDLLKWVYSSNHRIIQKAITVNWPKTVSIIDVFIYFILIDCGYEVVKKKGQPLEYVKWYIS